MATVLDSFTVPRSPRFRTAFSAPALSVGALSSSLVMANFPEFRGLRIQSCHLIRTLSSVSSRILPRGGRGGGIVCEAQEVALEALAVTEATWQSLVLEDDLPVMVEFWASWCGPCRMIHPLIDELSKEYVGKMKCYKLNTDESPSITTQYGIRSIPTVIIFKNGEKKDALIGAVPKSTLIATIEKFL